MLDILSLPLELRYMIYSYLMDPDREAPLNPMVCGRRKEIFPMKRLRLTQDRITNEALIKLPMTRTFITTAWTDLAQVNKQLHSELTGYAQAFRTKHQQPRYKLDVMVDQDRIYPTWLHFPYAAERVETLEVDFRIFEDYKPRGQAALTPEQDKFFFNFTNGNVPITLTLLKLLRRFVMNKDDQFHIHNHKKNFKPRSVNKIVVDFKVPEECLGFNFWTRWLGRGSRTDLLTSGWWNRTLGLYRKSPRERNRELAKRIVLEISQTILEALHGRRLNLRDRRENPSSWELGGKVNTIEMKIDGEMYRSLDCRSKKWTYF